MGMEQNEIREEEGYLQEVIRFAGQRMAELNDKKALLREEITAQTEIMRDELTQVIRDFDDIIQLSMENAVLTRAQKQYGDNEKEYRRLDKLKDSPYFARIDFVDREFGEENRVYIGASGLSDAKSYQMYVCDWRAPVCELFYGFDVGEAWYETARGRVDVDLSKKRQYKISGGQLQGMYDSDSSLYDEILQEVLSGQTTSGLKVIVDSIQKEQNRAIRFTKSPHVLIYGPAGSGKTSVGMHRLAYILYAQKERLKAEDVVILSSNQIFSTYVAGILPQLGEEDVSPMVFGELLDGLLPRHITCEDFYSQYRAMEGAEAADVDENADEKADKSVDESAGENADDVDENTDENAGSVKLRMQKRSEQIRLKYSGEMIRFIEKYFREYTFDLPDIRYGDEILISGEALNERMRRRTGERKVKGLQETYEQRLELLVQTVKKLYENYFLEHQEQICKSLSEEMQEGEEEELGRENLQFRYRRLRRQVIMDAVETIRNRNQADAYTHFLRILRLFSKEKGLSESMDRQAAKDWEWGKLRFEDALLYAITRLFTGEIKPFFKVLHVLIDEAQDYNPLQVYLVRMLYPNSDFTLLADSSQAVSPVMSLQQFGLLEETWDMISEEPLERLLLAKSYRSSAPINELAFSFLRQFDPACAEAYTYFERGGKEPVFLNTLQPEKAVLELSKELGHHHLVGIITANEADAKALYEKCDKDDFCLITDPGEEIRAGRVIMPLILAKGLEFDAVILYRCRDRLQDKESYARKMYLACTRALHELYLVDEGAF